MAMHSNVYIRGVPAGFDTEDLRYLFESYGGIISAKILEPRHIGDKRLGFVKFGTTIEAQEAIRDMDGHVIAGQTLEVRVAEFDVDPKKNVLEKAMIENDNLFVRGFPSYWSADQLTTYFSQVGVVVSVRLLSCTMPARGGVGLVRYRSVEEAREAIHRLSESSVEGFGPITVKYSTVKESRRRCRQPFRKSVLKTSLAYRSMQPSMGVDVNNDSSSNEGSIIKTMESVVPKAVLVCNLPPSMNELILYREFGPFGGICSINIGMDEAQRCTGMAFVNFVEGDAAHRAVHHLHGILMDGYIVTVATQL